jgi:hypothetical protein
MDVTVTIPDGTDPITVTVPDGTDLNGAVVELYRNPDGHLAADVRIPAPAD